jgi:hypothetical protein
VTRLSPALLISGLVLGLDAIVCQLTALLLTLFTWFQILPVELTTGVVVPTSRLSVAAVLALWCPAAATLVLGVRTPAARLAGLVTAALLVVAGAAVAAGILDLGESRLQLVVGLVVMTVNIAVVALLATPAPARVTGPARTIELNV